MLILHPFLTGRLARWRLVEKSMKETMNSKDVWFARLEDIVAHLDNLREAGEYTPRIENLPYYTEPQR